MGSPIGNSPSEMPMLGDISQNATYVKLTRTDGSEVGGEMSAEKKEQATTEMLAFFTDTKGTAMSDKDKKELAKLFVDNGWTLSIPTDPGNPSIPTNMRLRTIEVADLAAGKITTADAPAQAEAMESKKVSAGTVLFAGSSPPPPPGGKGNPWLGANASVTYMMNMVELFIMLKHNKVVEGDIAINAAKMVMALAQNAKEQIKTAADQEQAMLVADIVGAAVSIGVTALGMGLEVAGAKMSSPKEEQPLKKSGSPLETHVNVPDEPGPARDAAIKQNKHIEGRNAERQENNQQIKSHQDSIASKRSQIETNEAKIENGKFEAGEDKGKLQAENKTLKEEVQTDQQQVEKYANRNAALDNNKELAAEAKFQTKEADVKKIEGNQKQLDIKQTEINANNAKMEANESEVFSNDKQISANMHESGNNTKLIKEKQGTIDTNQDKIIENNRRLKTIEENRNSRVKIPGQDDKYFDKQKAPLEVENKQLKIENNKLETEKDWLQDRNKSLNNTNKDLADRNTTLQADHKTLTENRTKLEGEHTALQSEHVKIEAGSTDSKVYDTKAKNAEVTDYNKKITESNAQIKDDNINIKAHNEHEKNAAAARGAGLSKAGTFMTQTGSHIGKIISDATKLGQDNIGKKAEAEGQLKIIEAMSQQFSTLMSKSNDYMKSDSDMLGQVLQMYTSSIEKLQDATASMLRH